MGMSSSCLVIKGLTLESCLKVHVRIGQVARKRAIMSLEMTFTTRKTQHVEECLDMAGRSSFTNEKDHHYFLNMFVCVSSLMAD